MLNETMTKEDLIVEDYMLYATLLENHNAALLLACGDYQAMNHALLKRMERMQPVIDAAIAHFETPSKRTLYHDLQKRVAAWLAGE